MEDLTARQRNLLDFLVTYVDQHGYPPSFRDIAAALGFKSTNGVAYQLRVLEERGYLERDTTGSLARAIRLGRKATGSYRESSTVAVPIVGMVAAGTPRQAEEVHEGVFHLDAQAVPRGANVFGLRVRGESMIEDGILDGDLVLVRRQAAARHDDVVVALVDGETTVKRLFQKDGRTALVPANRDMQPIELGPKQESSVLGVVVGLYRSLQ